MDDLRQTSAWANYLKSIDWKVEKINNNYYFLKKLPILGYLLKIQRSQKIDFNAIKKLTKKYKIWKVSIEPINKQKLPGYKLTNIPYLPTKTLQINLLNSQKQILSQMKSKTRYNIRLAQKKDIQIVNSKNINEFVNFWRTNFERKRFPLITQKKNLISLFKAFGKNADLLIAKKNNKLIAGLFLLRTKDKTFYMYATSNDKGKKMFAPTLLTWEGIVLAKKNKCKIFDFDGIYDERFPIKSWLGFTKFKKGFGGYEIKYPGCFTKIKFCQALLTTCWPSFAYEIF